MKTHKEDMYSKQVVGKVKYLFDRYGDDLYFGEEITQAQHAFQCLHLAMMKSDDDEVQLAAFLHDIGHLCEEENLCNGLVGFGNLNHEKEGARYLMELGFSNRVCDLVENHVLAKRYLVSVNEDYYRGLSNASKTTLEYQGGLLNAFELVNFKAKEAYSDYIFLRNCDDLGKSTQVIDENWDLVYALIVKHIRRQVYIKVMTQVFD